MTSYYIDQNRDCKRHSQASDSQHSAIRPSWLAERSKLTSHLAKEEGKIVPCAFLVAETANSRWIGEVQPAHIMPDIIVVREVTEGLAAKMVRGARWAACSCRITWCRQETEGRDSKSFESRGEHSEKAMERGAAVTNPADLTSALDPAL